MYVDYGCFYGIGIYVQAFDRTNMPAGSIVSFFRVGGQLRGKFLQVREMIVSHLVVLFYIAQFCVV